MSDIFDHGYDAYEDDLYYECLPTLYTLKYESIEAETEKAFLFVTSEYGKVWVPKSQIISEKEKEVTIPKWIQRTWKEKETL